MESELAHLADLEGGTDLQTALEFFDALPALDCEELTGRWRGREVRTGHPMDGLLEATGWYGKQFDDVDHVHPLLFRGHGEEIVSVDPRRVPLGLAGKIPAGLIERGRAGTDLLKPALRTRRHTARLRAIEYRGVVSAAMVYDHRPIIDHFRRVDGDTVLGAMDLRDSPPYLFALARDTPS